MNLERIYSPGDVVIGGLFPVHILVNGTQVMIYAIEQINNSTLLPNVNIGYDIYDTCSNVSMALYASLKLMEGETPKTMCLVPNGDVNNNVKAVVGELSSEVSVSVARLLALPLMPQISYASTSQVLCDRSKFPSFFRTVPNDEHQAEAIAELVKNFSFVPVGIIGSEDEYGMYGAENVEDSLQKNNVCVEFKLILPADFSPSHPTLPEIRKNLRSWRSEAIVIFTEESNAKIILREAVNSGVNRTWIASDAWSNSLDILNLENLSKCGRIFGVTCKKNTVPGFLEYMEEFINQANTNGSFLSESPFCPPGAKENLSCSSFVSDPENQRNGQNCIEKTCLLGFFKKFESYEAYGVYMAVNIIAQGLKIVLQDYNGTDFSAWELTEKIPQANFSLDNETYIALNAESEVHIGYEILEWSTEGQKKISTIGTYKQSLNFAEGVVQEYTTLIVTQFNCSKSCKPGYELYILYQNTTCCQGCRRCERTFYSDDGISCQPCQDSNNSQCLQKFLPWTNGFSIALAVLASLGLLVTVTFSVLFFVYNYTPIVRAAGGNLCFPALVSLMCCFASVFLFLGMPTNITCKSGLPLFSLSFTVCVSSILANLLQIFLGFNFKFKLGDWLRSVNKPVSLLIVCSSVQVIICAVWLVLKPPFISTPDNGLLDCEEGSMEIFLATQVYIAILCVICFLFAYKGRRLPDLYKNARFITMSMLIYLVVWMIFIPVYLQEKGRYQQVVKGYAILVSGFGILGCHFAPKCYILLWKKELNDENMLTEYIRNHYVKKGIIIMK
ncbi:G-protein coupled receptor family C group 6 member A-like [Hoplias malabaricus]|uniref:G-protein coupled receptor family C group 6 member A-like n=1 Tax=Hoplias malabaricus TaxID=27720 RepID=UPI0034635FEC